MDKWIPTPGDMFAVRGLLPANWNMNPVRVFRCGSVENGYVRTETPFGMSFGIAGWSFIPVQPYIIEDIALRLATAIKDHERNTSRALSVADIRDIITREFC